MISDENVRRVIDAAGSYDANHPYYDGVFNETGERLREQGFATKTDIAVLAFWKTINLSTRWPSKLLDKEPHLVENVTRSAFQDGASDEERLSALSQLPGFYTWKGREGGAIPSTLLCCWDPENYAVTDVRVREELARLGSLATGVREYFEEARAIRDRARELRFKLDATARDVDKGLFTLAGDKKRR